MSAKVRQTIYLLGSVISGLLGIFLIWGGVEGGTADQFNNLVAGVMSLFGAGASGLAARTTGKQRVDGTLEADPLQQILNGVEGVAQAKAVAENEYSKAQTVLSGLAAQAGQALVPVAGYVPPQGAELITNLVSPIPVVGPLTSQLLSPYSSERQ